MFNLKIFWLLYGNKYEKKLMSLMKKEKLNCPKCSASIPSIYSQKCKNWAFDIYERCSTCGGYITVFKPHFCGLKKGKLAEIPYKKINSKST